MATSKTPFSAPSQPTAPAAGAPSQPTSGGGAPSHPTSGPPAYPSEVDDSSRKTNPIEPIGMTPTLDPKSESNRLCFASPSDQNQTAESTAPPKMPDLSTPEAVQAFLKDNPSALCYMSKAEIVAMLQGPEAAAKFKDGVAPEVGSTPPSAGTQPAPQPAPAAAT